MYTAKNKIIYIIICTLARSFDSDDSQVTQTMLLVVLTHMTKTMLLVVLNHMTETMLQTMLLAVLKFCPR